MLSDRKVWETALVELGFRLGICSNDLHLYYNLCYNIKSVTNKWNWCSVRAEKESREKGLCIRILQWNRWSVCHPYAWGRRLPAYHLDPCYGTVTLDSMKMNGTSLSCGRLYPGAGKSGWASRKQYSRLWLRLWRNAALFSNACLVERNSCW